MSETTPETGPPTRDALLAALRGRDAFRRRSSLEAIGKLPRDEDLERVVLDALSDSSGYVKRTACAIVASWSLRVSHARLLTLLDDREAMTRSAAIRSLAVIGSEQDVVRLLNTFTNDSSGDVRRDAAWCLNGLAGHGSWDEVFEHFYRDRTSHQSRVFACRLAERFAGIPRLSELKRLSQDNDGHVRKAAEHALAVLTQP